MSPEPPPPAERLQAQNEASHPRGTLAVVLIYAALFVLGWLALYLIEFIPRGTSGP